MQIFDGIANASGREQQLQTSVSQWVASGQQPPVITAILFREDTGSQLYTRLKSEAARRVGIEYRVYDFSLCDNVALVKQTIEQLNADDEVTGIIVQKPWRKLWQQVRRPAHEAYDEWWHAVMAAVTPAKDVDGLHPQTLSAIKDGSWQAKGCVLPATCRAVLQALEEAKSSLQRADLGKVVIIGKSDLLGIPLSYVLQQQGSEVELIGSKELAARMESGQKLTDAGIVVSATGQKHVVTGEMIADGVVLVDVGEPRPDIDRASVADKAAFLTPVPGGIGPLTVTFLLENAMILAAQSRE